MWVQKVTAKTFKLNNRKRERSTIQLKENLLEQFRKRDNQSSACTYTYVPLVIQSTEFKRTINHFSYMPTCYHALFSQSEKNKMIGLVIINLH